jgi:peptide/nickel transport system ATP-binding protein
MLKVKNLKTVFKVGDKSTVAVDGISFDVPKKSIVGIVGESGSGKSVTALSILDLLPNNGKVENGQIIYQDQNLQNLTKKEMQKIRGSEIGLIFQNPLASLNPVFSIGNQMIETILLHQDVNKKEAKALAIELLKKVNIPDPEHRINDYPHQFSLGMCQRIMIALTLSMKPTLLIADEPTASLDVTIQAQILDLLMKIKDEFDMSILIISHDLGVIAQFCDYIVVMYLGKIVEKGVPKEIFSNPQHPYTKALISAIPKPDPSAKTPVSLLRGDVPSTMNVPKGCHFHPRCPNVMPECSALIPTLEKVKNGSEVACLLYQIYPSEVVSNAKADD